MPSDFSLYWAMVAFLSMTFGKFSISSDFDASRVDGLTRGLASFYKGRVLQTPGRCSAWLGQRASTHAR